MNWLSLIEAKAAQWLLRQPGFHHAVRRVHKEWYYLKSGERRPPEETGLKREGEKGTMHNVWEEMKNQADDLAQTFRLKRRPPK